MVAVATGAELLGEYLRAQAEEIERAGRAVADADPEGVHDLRVACRRARSALRDHRRLVRKNRRTAVTDLAGDLRLLGLDLSGPRDDEVTRALVVGWARQDDWDEETVTTVLEALGDQVAATPATSTVAIRATSLGAAVRSWVEIADWRPRATRDAERALTPVADRGSARLERRVNAARSASHDDAPAMWHEVRKAVKRVRYVAEAARPAIAPASAVVSSAKALQTVLGDRQDAQVVLVRLAGAPEPTSAPVLLAVERARRAVREAGDAVPATYEALRRAQTGRA